MPLKSSKGRYFAKFRFTDKESEIYLMVMDAHAQNIHKIALRSYNYLWNIQNPEVSRNKEDKEILELWFRAGTRVDVKEEEDEEDETNFPADEIDATSLQDVVLLNDNTTIACLHVNVVNESEFKGATTKKVRQARSYRIRDEFGGVLLLDVYNELAGVAMLPGGYYIIKEARAWRGKVSAWPSSACILMAPSELDFPIDFNAVDL